MQVSTSNNNAYRAGAAYVFVREGTNWAQQAYLKASNTGTSDQFGYFAAVSGDTIAIGANAEDSNAVGVNGDGNNESSSNSGAAYVFVRSATNWAQQAYLKASNTGMGDFFGETLALSGGILVVGTYLEDSRAVGVNPMGGQPDNDATDAGAAYVFVRDGTNWGQQAYLKASNNAPGNQFGHSVTVSGDTVVVAARAEDSGAIGVNGDQFDNTASNSGAAYVFTGLGVGPRLSIVPHSGGGRFIRFNCVAEATYRLQRSLSVGGLWSTIAASTAPAFGLIEFDDTNAPNGQAFYRVVQP